MGNDGGTISKRDEMVRTKVSTEKVDPELLRQSLWTICSLSRSPLSPPVSSDALGRLYNKDAVVQHLLLRRQQQDSSSSSKVADPIAHVRGLRDIKELKLTPNTLYRPPSPGSSANEHSVYPFQCPLSGKQMDGKQKVVYIANCGCAMSFTGLRTTLAPVKDDTVQHQPCPVCGEEFDATTLLAKGKATGTEGVVTINPNAEEEAEMRQAMETARAKEAAEKSKKKDKTRTAAEVEDKESAERKRRKAEKKADRSARIAALTAELAAEKV